MHAWIRESLSSIIHNFVNFVITLETFPFEYITRIGRIATIIWLLFIVNTIRNNGVLSKYTWDIILQITSKVRNHSFQNKLQELEK